jgi:8-oxo-dGTP pyrophosphatase MutT (NUDIX family)
LFLQKRENKPGIFAPGKLGVFGGHIDPEDANPEAAGIRELQEETRIKVDSLMPLGEIAFESSNLRGERVWKIVHAFSTLVSPKLYVPVYEGEAGITLPFGENIPRTLQPTGTLIKELDKYYPDEYPNLDDFQT